MNQLSYVTKILNEWGYEKIGKMYNDIANNNHYYYLVVVYLDGS